MYYTYYLMQNSQGFIDLEPADNAEWIEWLYANGYSKVGQVESDYSFRYLEQGIARSYFRRIMLD